MESQPHAARSQSLRPLPVALIAQLLIALTTSTAAIAAASEVLTVSDCTRLSPEHRLVESYYEGGEKDVLESQACSVGDTRDGPYRAWHESGKLKTRGSYLNGEMFGSWERWHSSGNRKDRGEWIGDKPHGEWNIWHSSGELKSRGDFQSGREEGLWTYWRVDGSKQSEGLYQAGKKICHWSEWSKAGERRAVRKADSDLCTRQAQAMGTVGSWSASLGYSGVVFREGSAVDATFQALTAKLMYRSDLIASRYDVSGNVYGTLLPLSRSGPETVRYLGANLRAGVLTPLGDGRISVILSAGISFSKMLVSGGQDFGYKTLLYPQLYPALGYRLSGGGVLSLYAKFVPLNEGLSPVSPEREIALGLGWQNPFGLSERVILNLDHSDTRLKLNGLELTSIATTLGATWLF